MAELHPNNAERAEWAESAVNTFGHETYGGRTFTAEVNSYLADDLTPDQTENSDAYTMIQDLIGDCLHLAKREGWDPDDLLRRAKNNFDHENAPGYEGD
jgi:hypothetical protein